MLGDSPLYILVVGVNKILISSKGMAIYDTLILNSFASFFVKDDESILWQVFS